MRAKRIKAWKLDIQRNFPYLVVQTDSKPLYHVSMDEWKQLHPKLPAYTHSSLWLHIPKNLKPNSKDSKFLVLENLQSIKVIGSFNTCIAHMQKATTHVDLYELIQDSRK